MPKRISAGRIVRPRWDELAPLAVLTACFAAGALTGALLCAGSGEGGGALGGYLRGYISALTAGTSALPSFWAAAWELCRWPLLVFLLGFTAFAAAAVPAAFFVRGLLLGYAVGAFGQVFGRGGLLAALCVFGMTVLFSLPALFAAGSGAFSCAVRGRSSHGEGGDVPVSRRLVRAAAWLPALLSAAVVQWAVMPGVVRDVCTFLNLNL